MDYELHANEAVAETDALIAQIEAEIRETKARLRDWSLSDELF